jgi:hypothetical protein
MEADMRVEGHSAARAALAVAAISLVTPPASALEPPRVLVDLANFWPHHCEDPLATVGNVINVSPGGLTTTVGIASLSGSSLILSLDYSTAAAPASKTS